MFGYSRKILRINLDKNDSWEEELTDKMIRKYLGGKGFGAKILYEELKKRTDPLSKDNKIIFATGPFTNNGVVSAGKNVVITKSPLTGLFLDCYFGGGFGKALKQAGFDVLIIEGKSQNPCYILITDKVEIKDAKALWSKTTFETEKTLSSQGKVACIGPAGENLVRISSIFSEGRIAARGGIGAVMGSKLVKAVVVSGDKKSEAAYPDLLKKEVKILIKSLKKSETTGRVLPTFGTSSLVNLMNEAGMLATKNFKEGEFENAENISGERIKKNVIKKYPCIPCPISCGRIITGGIRGPEFETLGLLGSNCRISNIETLYKANYLCDAYGIDTISTGGTIAFAMELSERGMIEEKIKWSDRNALILLIGQIAKKEDIGDLLSEGVKHVSEKVGGKEFAMHVKGMEFPAYDPRGSVGMALAYATSDRGACHLRSYPLAEELWGDMDRFSYEGKAELVAEMQDMFASLYSLSSCFFVFFAFDKISMENYKRILKAITGDRFDLDQIGERVWNTTRLFNVREGISRKDDTLPDRIMNESTKKGKKIDYEKFQQMLSEYYEIRGWNEEGIPKKKKIKELML